MSYASPDLPQPKTLLPTELQAHLEAVHQALWEARQQIVAEMDSQLAHLEDLKTRLLQDEVTASDSIPLCDLFSLAPETEEKLETFSKPLMWTAASPLCSTLVLEPVAPVAIDPTLEEATLDELNKALGQAFSQMTQRSA